MLYRAVRASISLLIFSTISFNVFSDVEEYVQPRIDGIRLDWCLNYGSDCGEEVAYKWCIVNNYSKPIYWEIDKNIGIYEPTSTLNSRESCFESSCDGFKTIVCYSSTY